jgi:uncharacterized protein (TIGR03000 family)
MFKTDWLGVKVAVLAAAVVLTSAGESQACGRWGSGGWGCYGGWDYGCCYSGYYGGWGYPVCCGYSYPYYSYATPYYAPMVASSANYSYAMPASASNDPAGGAAQGNNAALIDVDCPANAQIFFDGNPTAQTGGQRRFLSPELAPGKTYTYEVRATWVGSDNKAVTQTREVQVQAGKRSSANFGQ